jgi:hypothetical protein
VLISGTRDTCSGHEPGRGDIPEARYCRAQGPVLAFLATNTAPREPPGPAWQPPGAHGALQRTWDGWGEGLSCDVWGWEGFGERGGRADLLTSTLAYTSFAL